MVSYWLNQLQCRVWITILLHVNDFVHWEEPTGTKSHKESFLWIFVVYETECWSRYDCIRLQNICANTINIHKRPKYNTYVRHGNGSSLARWWPVFWEAPSHFLNNIWFNVHWKHFRQNREMCLKISSARCGLFCLVFNMLIIKKVINDFGPVNWLKFWLIFLSNRPSDGEQVLELVPNNAVGILLIL